MARKILIAGDVSSGFAQSLSAMMPNDEVIVIGRGQYRDYEEQMIIRDPYQPDLDIPEEYKQKSKVRSMNHKYWNEPPRLTKEQLADINKGNNKGQLHTFTIGGKTIRARNKKQAKKMAAASSNRH